jgi:hypothetical protein
MHITHSRTTRASGAAADLQQFIGVTEDRTRSVADRQVASPNDRATCRQAGAIVVEGLTVIGGLLVFGSIAYFFLVI